MPSLEYEAFLAGLRAKYSEIAAKAVQGDRNTISWIKAAEERHRRPTPRHYVASQRPTLDDFDKPGVVWGNA